MTAAVLAILLSLPPAVADRAEDPEARAARLADLAADIAAASELPRWRGSRLQLAALLVTIAWHETRLGAAYQLTRRHGLGHALGSWQIEPGARVAGDPLRATTAAAQLARSWQCGAGPRGWLTAYAGRPCGSEWPGLAARVHTYHWIAGRLAVVTAKP